jgi:hypothetical protein
MTRTNTDPAPATMTRSEALASVTPHTLGRMVERSDGGLAHRLRVARKALAVARAHRGRARTLALSLAIAHTHAALQMHATQRPYAPGSAEAREYAAGRTYERWLASRRGPVDAQEREHDRLARLAGMISVNPTGRDQAWTQTVPEGFAVVGGPQERKTDPYVKEHGVSVTYRLAEPVRAALKATAWLVVMGDLGLAKAHAYERMYDLALAGAAREQVGTQRPGRSNAHAYSATADATLKRAERKAAKAATASHVVMPDAMAALARSRMGTSAR